MNIEDQTCQDRINQLSVQYPMADLTGLAFSIQGFVQCPGSPGFLLMLSGTGTWHR